MSAQAAARVGELLARATRALAAAGVDEAPLEARILLGHASGLSAASLLAHPERDIGAETAGRFLALVAERARRVPSAYLLGEREFYGRPFLVAPAVLIPRPETEMLVGLALAEMRRRRERARVLDVGTGSGAIAVTLALEAPRAAVFACDLSASALAVARANGARLGGRVGWFMGDLLGGVRGPVDVIAANLPYVSGAELGAASPEVREHEPRLALHGGERGTELYERFMAQLPAVLAADGVALLEIGWRQGAALAAAARAALPEATVDVVRDAAGLDRVLRIRRAEEWA